MSQAADTKLLALLVHRGKVSHDLAAKAVAAGDVRGYLLTHGGISDEQWQRWLRTDGGTRPELSRYELGEMLGEGGSARVFAARDRTTGEHVALKVLKPSVAEGKAAVEAFVRESKLLIELDCPHIVKGVRVAREGQTFFCAMELVEGKCLQEGLAPKTRLDEDVALDVVMQVGRALSYLHGKGLVHRDVKPGNVLLCEDGRAVLIDLGFALSAAAGAPAAETTAGTVHYISPEQARGQDQLDVRADIYSLGATLYHLVTGSLPFSGESGEEVMAKQVLESLSGDAIRALGLRPQTHYFIEKMMAKEKEIRFQTPDELVVEIESHLATRAREVEVEEAEQQRRKSKRRMRRFL